MSGAPWVAATAAGCVLTVRVIPRANRTALAGERAGALLVRLAAPPVEGAANAALIAFLAECLQVARRQLTIASGETSRDKRIQVSGLSADAARTRLSGAHPESR